MTRRAFLQIAALACLLVAIVVGVIAFRGVGRWLERPDPLGQAGVIVVLSGSMPWRAEEAANIFHLGYAHEVWVTRPISPAGELAGMGLQFQGEEYYNREVLIHQGVPETLVRVLPDTIVDTEQEIEEIAAEMRKGGKTRAIVVTSLQHTRRVKTLWRKLAGDNLRAIVRSSPQDPFDADHWWRDTGDVFSVAREIMGLMNAWAGFPVQPHPR